ncbi:MAG: DNA primase, partial [Candidatus Syntrophonatronum acetioxidans]
MNDFLPEDAIEEVRQHFDLVEVISGYTSLKKAGRNYTGLCPFHSEKTPSFTVSPEKQLYHCFGCGAGGNVFSFIMAVENLSFPEAVKFLANRAGITLPERQLSEQGKKIKIIKEELAEINELSMKYFQQVLFKTEMGKKALNYLIRRGLDKEIIKKFQLGYSLPQWDKLINFLKGKGYTQENILKAGLASRSERGSYYDRFRNRIMFPIFNQQNMVIGFGGRVMDDSQPKYLNSPETILYNKRKSLYALNFARFNIREKDEALVFEGYMDVLTAFQRGLENCVASLGTSLTEDQARLLRRNASRVVIAYDSDTAGEAATWRGLDTLSSAGCRVKVAQLPPGQDPDDFVRKKGINTFHEEIVKKALPLIDYKLKKIGQELGESYINTYEGKISYIQKILPILAGINNSVEFDLYLQKVSSETGIDPGALKAEIKKYKKRSNKKGGNYVSEIEKKVYSREKPPPAERELLMVLLKCQDSPGEIKERLDTKDFTFTPYRKIVEVVYNLFEQGKEYTPSSLLNSFDDPDIKNTIVNITMGEEPDLENRKRIVEDCITKIKRHQLVLQRKEIEKKISQLEKDKNAGEINNLLEEWSKLKRREKELVPYRRE